MKCLAPRQLPQLSELLYDLGNPSNLKIARHLGVSERTVRRWRALNRVPRAAHVVLFMESSYGQSAMDCDLHNGFVAFKNLSESLRRQNATLAARVTWLEQNGSFGASNAPDFHGQGLALGPVSAAS